MKILNIALSAVLATIGTAPCVHARIASSIRDPRTVEKKEEVRRQTMGEHVLDYILIETAGDSGKTCGALITTKEGEYKSGDTITDEEKSLACSAVSNQYPECLGCQGYTLDEKKTSVHIPGCVGMSPEKCVDLAQGIVGEKPDWFIDRDLTTIIEEKHDVYAAGNVYYAVALPVPENGDKIIKGLKGGCMVNYPWDWCVNDTSDNVKCIKIPPFDCSVDENGGDLCLSSSECCDRIQDGDHYPAPDINQNYLQCYEWEIPATITKSTTVPGSTASSGTKPTQVTGPSKGAVGSRLVMHISAGKVHIPAVITDGNYGVVPDFMADQPLNVGPITLKSYPNKCMEKGPAESGDGDGDVYMADCDSDAVKQQFYYNTDTMQIMYRNEYRHENDYSAHLNDWKCLDYNDGTENVYMNGDCHGNTNQRWHMTVGNQLKTFKNQHCLDMRPDGQDAYDLYMRACHNDWNQKFDSRIPISPDGAIKLADDTKDECMRIDGDNAKMEDCNESEGAQHFYYDAVTMQIYSHGKCLDYNYGDANSNVYVSGCHQENDNNVNQKWYMTEEGQLKTKHDDKCLDKYLDDNGNLYMSDCHGGANQKFAPEIPIIVK